jgi:hypothetical protein
VAAAVDQDQAEAPDVDHEGLLGDVPGQNSIRGNGSDTAIAGAITLGLVVTAMSARG